MTMFRFSSMKQVLSGLFTKKDKKDNRKERHLVVDALEARELLTVTPASTASFYVNELPIYETSSDIIEQIQNLRDNNLSVDYDMGGDDDGDLVVAWERPDVIYTTKEGETSQFQPVIDNTTLSPSLDWNIYARYLTNETQRLYLDYDAFNTGTYSNIGLFYGQMQNLDPNGMVEDPTVDTKIASGLVYKISFTSQAQPLTPNQDSINARFSIYAYDSTGQSTVSTFTFNEEYAKTLSIDATTDKDVLNYTNSMETNAAELQAKLRGLGQTQGKYLNDCVVKAISPTEFYVYVYSEDIQATWDGSKWVYTGVPNLAIYQENPEGNDASGFEVSADISIVSAPSLYNNIKVDPSRPLDSADNIQKAFDAKKNTNISAPIFMPAPDRINAQRRDILEGPATESDMLISGGVYPEVLVVPVYGLTDADGNSLDGYVYDITFVGSSSYINHPLLTALASDGTDSLSDEAILKVVTVKESSSEFRVNSLEEADPADSDDPFKEVTYYNQLNPAVAMDADGDFVVTWQSEVSNVLVRGSYTDIYAKTYSARSYINDHSYLNDAYVEEETEKMWPSDMMVNTVDTYTYIEVDPDNLEQNYYQKNSKTNYIQSVVVTKDEFRVNTSTTNAQRNPDVAMDLDGNFVIVWDSEGQTISYFNGVYMQRYDKNGKAVSAETRVDTEVTGASTNPSVAADDNGQFVVTWEYTNNPLMDIQFPYYTFYNHYFNYYYEEDFYYMSEIHASVYNTIYPTNEEFGLIQEEFVVGATDDNGGKDPQAAWSDTGDFIISWTGLETDTDSTGEISSGVYAEQYKVSITETPIEEENNEPVVNPDENGENDENAEDTSEEPATELKKTVNKVRNVYRVNSATFNVDNPTYWDYSQLVGQVGLDADGDVIVTYAGYGPDISVNDIIPFISGVSLSTTNSYTLFLNNMKNLLNTQTQILQAKYGDEPFADLTNFFNPTGRSKNPNPGDYFGTITKDKVDEDGTLVTFTSNRMINLLREINRDPLISDDVKAEVQDLTGRYECHGDVNSVIAMVLTNAQLLFKYDPQYETLRQNPVEFHNVQNVVLGALASVLESQFGLLRGESSGVMFTQIDAAVDKLTAENADDGAGDGADNAGAATNTVTPVSTDLAPSAIIHSDSVANSKRDGVTAVANIALDVDFNRIWDNISFTLVNKANQQSQAIGVDLFGVGAYEDIGDGLFRLNNAKAAEAIEQAISQATNLVGTSWRDETNRELDLYEGPVEVRAIDWNELQSRGLMHIDNETTRYSNASMDMEMFRRWYTENATAIGFELGIMRFDDFTFNDLLDFINNEDLDDDERADRIESLPVIFEIVFQGSVHDLELSMTWENATVRNAEVQNLTLNPTTEGTLYYAIQVNGQPDAFENPGQLLTFDCTDENSVMASIDSLRAYLVNLGYNPVDVELVSSPTDDDGETIWGVGEYQIRIGFAGNVGENITLQYFGTFVLPPLTEQGGYNPSDYPWLRNGRFRTIQDGGTVNRARYGISMYYYGDLGTPQTDPTINVTPEGSFQIGYLQHELYNSRTMSNQYANSTFNSYSNTNVLVRSFVEKTDTAGPKVSGLNIDGKRVQQKAEINGENINYVIVYFNEEMMYYDYRTKFSNSESADWDNSVINPENWQLTKDGTPLQGVINDIYYGMNMSQYILDENGNPLSEFGSNKWEAVIMLDSPLVNGSYEIVANKRMEDVKGNRLSTNGQNGDDGVDATFSFNVTTYDAEGPIKGEGSDKNYFEQTLEGNSDFRWSPNAVGINDDGDTVTVWISENDEGVENIYYQIEYVELVDGNYVVNPEKTIKLTLFDEGGVAKNGDEHNIQHASVAMGEDGDFIITWSEYNLDSSNGKVSWDVYARRYNLDGTPKDNLPTLLSYEEGINNHESLRVNTSTLGDQMYSSVAISALGNYAITWMSLDYQDISEKINADWDIYAAQYYADGSRRVDEVATQEIIFTSAIYDGSFRIQYTPDQSKYLETDDDIRTTSQITIIPPVGDDAYGKIEFNGVTLDNTPANFALIIKKALQEINIDAVVEPTSYEFYTVKFKSMDGSPIPANLGELAVLPTSLLLSSEGKAVNTTVRTKYAADSGEILVNESYLLSPGAAEIQRVSFGTGSNFSNLVSFYFEFDYTDFEGVVHNCKTTQPVVFRPGVNGAAGNDDNGNANDNDAQMSDGDQHLFDEDFEVDSDEYYHRIDSIINALGTFKDQFGNTVTIASDLPGDSAALDRDIFLLGVDNNKNTVTVYFANAVLGYDVSDLRISGVQVEDKKIAVNVTSKEISQGTMGGILANPTAIAIANNPDNYFDLESRHQMFPDIGMDAEGNFVVTWTSYGDAKYGDSSTEANVYARRYDTNGNTICVGLVNTDNLEGTQKWSSVDMDRKGDFVISWTSDYEDNIEIYAKRYAFLKAYYEGEAAASTLDPERDTPASYYTEAYDTNKAGFLIDYKDSPIFFHSGIVDGTFTVENYADLEYKALGGSFIVNTTQLGKQQYSKVAMDANGNFIITWESDDATFNVADKEYSIYAQKYLNNINALSTTDNGKAGNEMSFSHTAVDGHSDRFPSVAMNSDGDWIIAWTCFPERDDTQSEIWHVVNREKPYDDNTSPVITKFQAVSPVEQGDLFTYVYDNDGNRVTDENGNPVFTWADSEQRYSVNDDNEINTVDINGVITSNQPLNNPENPTYVYDDTTQKLDIYQQDGSTTTKDVTVTDDLPYEDFTSNGLLNYIFTNDEDTGQKEYAFTDTKDSYLDIGNGKIYNSEYKTQDMDYLISKDYALDENGEQVVALIVGFSEEMSHTGASSVLNPSNWNIYRTDIEGNKILVPIQDIVDREDSMFSVGDDGKNEIVIYIKPGDDGLPALEPGYTYEFIGSTNMEDLNKNPLDGSYSKWDYGKTNGQVGGTESTDFEMAVDVGIPSSLDSGNVSEDPNKFEAADLKGDTLVNYNNQEGIQENSAVAMDQYGNYVVVWETDWIPEDRDGDYQNNPALNRFLYKDGQLIASSNDTSNGFRRIMAQMYDYDGNKVGQEFVVFLEEYTHQCSPDVAMDKYGNIVITWVEVSDTHDSHYNDSTQGDQESMTLDPYVDGSNIMAVRYKVTYDKDYYVTNMAQYGDVYQVDNDVRGAKTNPKVAIDSATSNYVIVWTNEDFSTYPETVLRSDNFYPDGRVDRCGIYARVYSFTTTDNEPKALNAMENYAADSSYYNKPFLVNIADTVGQSNPSVAMENGNLLVVWQNASTKTTINGRAFQLDAGGRVTAINDQVTISENERYSKYTPSVDMDTLGNAVVTYSSNLQDGSEQGIYARTFKVDSSGKQTLKGLSQPEFRVNNTTYDTQFEPVVGLGDDGRCVISWVSYGHEVSDYDASEVSRFSYGVFAKWYDDVFSNAAAMQNQKDVQINSLIYGSQFQQDISVNDKGECVFTWTGPGDLSRNYPGATAAGEGGEGASGSLTNIHDNLVNGSDLSGVSNHVSVLDYSDIYRRRFLRTASSPSSLSPGFVNGEGAGTIKQNEEIDDDVNKTVIFSVADGTWTMVQDDGDPQQINSKILDVDGNGSDVTLYGSAGADSVRFLTTTRNGKTVDAVEMTNSLGQKITLYNFSKVNVVGRGGNDSVTFGNEKGTESRKFAATGSSATLSTSSYSYSVVDFPNIAFNGVQGDSVTVTGTNGNDTVTLNDNSVTATGVDYTVTANGFSSVKLNANNASDENSVDVMKLEAKNITSFSADSDGGEFDTTDYHCDFSGFDTVTANAKSGTGSLSGNPDVSLNVTSADASLNMYSNKILLSENGKDVVLTNFGNVTANIAPEAADCTVRIYDSTGNDSYLFDAASKTATMTLANGYKLKAVGTTAAEAYSKFGGTDSATFNDSAAADTVQIVARVMRMTDGDITDPTAPNSYYVTANGFSVNNAFSTDKLDTALFIDETVIQGTATAYDVKDDFTVTCLDNKVMAFMQSTIKTSYSNTAWGFNNIVATSHSFTAVDTARVSDGQGDLVATTFDVSPLGIKMVLANGTTVDVYGFRNKIVESTESAINLYDGLSDDTLVMQENRASMSGDVILFGSNANTYTIAAQAPVITATSENGGSDKATIICSADKVEAIDVAHAGEAVTVNVADVNGTFNNTVKDFKSATVNKADSKDTANVVIVNSAYEMPITVDSAFNKFSYSQNGSYSRGVTISGALKSMDFRSENAGKLSSVNISLHDSALADLLDVTTSERKAVIEQIATQQTRSFTVSDGDMVTVSGDSTMDSKKVDGVLTDWDDWSDTDTWLKGE